MQVVEALIFAEHLKSGIMQISSVVDMNDFCMSHFAHFLILISMGDARWEKLKICKNYQ